MFCQTKGVLKEVTVFSRRFSEDETLVVPEFQLHVKKDHSENKEIFNFPVLLNVPNKVKKV